MGLGRVSPNPPVGAVILRDDRVIGEGWHRAYGGAHAEREAIADAEGRGESVAGATMLVTLEPCGHEGRQPPCADLLVEKGLSEVVYGCDDPSDKTAGVGPELLRRSGIEVSMAGEGIAARARFVTRGFRKHCATGKPLVVLKMAVSLDGRVAGPSGTPIRLTCPESDALIHRWRSEFDAIAVGSGTFASDDPRLTARGITDPVQPARVVFLGSSRASVPPDGSEAVFGDLPEAPLFFVLERGAGVGEAVRLEDLGATVIEVGPGSAAERFGEALEGLAASGLRTVLLEGGPGLAATALLSGEVDEVELFQSPVVLGAGPGAFDPLVEQAGERCALEGMAVSVSGRDIRLSRVLREW
jgi:diaminohydroxyphosphoribosylaminopyrimidine deaminase/5-amino-6-(5-phosphoribosylamino)uracil reductase